MGNELDNIQSIPAAFFKIAAEHPSGEVYSQAFTGDPAGGSTESVPRRWQQASFAEVSERVLKIAKFLLDIGTAKGDAVAILSNSRGEWMEADLAALSTGAKTVSVYHSLKANDIAYIVYDSGATIVFAENQEQVDKLLAIIGRPVPIPASEDRPAAEATITLKRIIAFEQVNPHPVVIQLSAILAGAAGEIPEAVREIKRGDVATFVYTSGTTGPPKGVVQTHGNHLSNVRQGIDAGLFRDDSRIMVFLPLAHSFAKLMGYIGFTTGATLAFPAVIDQKASKIDAKALTRDIREAGATIIPIVPRFLEKMQSAIVQRSQKGGIQGLMLRLMIWSAKEVHAAKHKQHTPRMFAHLIFGMCEPLRHKVKNDLFGPNFKYAISGGAKLPVDVNEFFDSLEIEVLEGYGLTETCVATNINRPGKKKIGSVGPALAPDIEIKIADDGEILFRGPNVSLGYHNRPTATNAAWNSEGWFHTGDLGKLDEEGNLAIVGRKKELLVTAGGKKIAVENIENGIKTSPYVSQAIMVGEGKPYCAALITLDEPAVKKWAEKSAITLTQPIHEDQKILKLIWQDVEKLNTSLASFESIKKIAILPEEFSVENELLTPTFKPKRAAIEKRFRDTIEALYTSGGVKE